jgi:hypothetical protein
MSRAAWYQWTYVSIDSFVLRTDADALNVT